MSVPRYDRRVHPDLVAALAPSGAMHTLAELVRQDFGATHGLDLQLRAIPEEPLSRATLYVGLTQVLHVHFGPEGFSLEGQHAAAYDGQLDRTLFNDEWESPQPLEALAESWDRVMEYICAAVRVVTDLGRGREGALHAKLAREDHKFLTIDREAIVSFPGDSRRLFERERDKVTAARDDLANRESWANTTKGFGGKLDLLALDPRGRVLVIEVKDGADTAGVGWTPAQVALYLRLFECWADHCTGAADILSAMLKQRQRLGLLPGGEHQIARPVRFVPVIAIGPDMRSPNIANQRMTAVRGALETQGIDLADLQFWQVDKHGAIAEGALERP